jgi:transposase-like protein
MTDLTHPIFSDENKAREHLEALRWPNGPVCPHCGGTHEHVAKVEHTGKRTKPVPEGKKHRPARKGLYICNACKEQFTVQVGTVLEKSHIPLNKWLAGFFLMCSSKKGVSAHQLHRTLAVSYKSAWFMAHRIREAMRAGGLAPPMGSDTLNPARYLLEDAHHAPKYEYSSSQIEKFGSEFERIEKSIGELYHALFQHFWTPPRQP